MLAEKFRHFYENHRVEQPPAIEQREFGFGVFKRKIADRHLAFHSYNELNAFLREEVPFFLSYSAAYYRFPDAQPMAAKGFRAADLIYEFDVDDFKLECQREHNLWKCSNCGAGGNGNQSLCDSCGAKTSIDEWVCPECMKAVKEKVQKLVSILQEDFAFDDFAVNYSGAKGFHVHIRSPAVQSLSHSARVELVNYLTGQGLEIQDVLALPPELSKGWGKRAWQELRSFLQNVQVDELAAISGERSKACLEWLEDRAKILSELELGKRLAWNVKKNNDRFWNALFDHCLKGQKLPIDRQTSIDIAKIIRCPDTLHGGTGLLAKTVPLQSLNSFDPLSQALAFSTLSTLKVTVGKTPKFFLASKWWGPFQNEQVELPEAVAVYLLCHGSAEVK